jgi:prevent-host-death family protein
MRQVSACASQTCCETRATRHPSYLASLARLLCMSQFGMHEAKTQLSRLVERALAGEDVVITRHGKPVVRLVPVQEQSRLANARGMWKGKVWMSDDFDEWTDELDEMFYGSE